MSGAGDSVLDWCVVAFVLGVISGGFLVWSTVAEPEEPYGCGSPRVYSMYDFNLAPYDSEGNLVTNPVPDLFDGRDRGYLVAVIVNPMTGEPFHFQAINEDTRLSELDVEFAACRELFEHADYEKVVDVFGKTKNQTEGKTK